MKHDEDEMGTSLPNMLPMIEIFLFLLLVTMGTATAKQYELAARLFAVKKATQSDRPGPLLFVRVPASGEYHMQGDKKASNLAEVEQAIRKTSSGTRIIVEPEPGTEWKHIAPVLSAAKVANRDAACRVTQRKKEDGP